jgi:uncharacterized protein involved in exopolysaccharide biosynthesis
VNQTGTKPQTEVVLQPAPGEISLGDLPLEDSSQRQAERLRMLWDHRRSFLRAGAIGLLCSFLVALLIPKQYTSTTQLMPPDTQSTSNVALMAALASKTGSGLSSVAGDLLGLKSSGALFIGVLRSQTSQDRLIQQFDLRKIYGTRLITDARTKLDDNTAISEDRKSGIITISVTDRSPQRAAAIAEAYVGELNSLVAELNTSSAHRERVFLEDRLKVAKVDLDSASSQFAKFSSENNTLDIQQEGKAMLDAAGSIAGEMIAAQAQLEGLRQIYTDNNARVRSLSARVAELRKQLDKLGGKQGGAADPLAGSAAGNSAAQASDIPYPTIHSLPLLGVKYGDFYRRVKIQETVFELLTQQYELAKVQEAKETPSVKVLDPATIPEKKSYPPRLLIIFLGTMLAVFVSVVWVLGSNRWAETDPQDPRKLLAQEVVSTMAGHMPWATPNGSRVQAATHRVWKRLARRNGSAEESEDPRK